MLNHNYVRLLLCIVGLVSGFAPLPISGQGKAYPQALRELERGNNLPAARLASAYLRAHPGDVAMRVVLARALLAQDDFAKAFEELAQALELDPKNIDAHYYLAVVAKTMSARQYQRLFTLAPDSYRVHQLLGEGAVLSDKPTEAETEFKLALKEKPESVEVLTELADLYRSQSKFDQATDIYLQAKDLGELSYEIAYGLGICYTYKQDFNRALQVLREAVRLEPKSADAHFALGNALFQNDKADLAINELEQSVQIEPKGDQALFLLGRAYMKVGRKEEATVVFRKIEEHQHQ
jgi:tetratricopeptide (TPR) repeat protein